MEPLRRGGVLSATGPYLNRDEGEGSKDQGWRLSGLIVFETTGGGRRRRHDEGRHGCGGVAARDAAPGVHGTHQKAAEDECVRYAQEEAA